MSQPPPQPVQTGSPQQSNLIIDPYGSGATFAWGSGGVNRIPKAGDPDFQAYNQELSRWLTQRQQAYMQSPQYQADQARDNPDIASGRVPAVGFVAEAPNAWGVPVGARVTGLERRGDNYSIAYQEMGTPQQVKVEGPGYSIEGTVFARNAQEAAVKAMGSTRAQYLGLDVSPNRLGAYVSDMRGSNQASVQAGDPTQNKYWESVGLPQFSGYSIPKLSDTQQAEGFYIKAVESAGTAPKITLGNTQWESFWKQQGYPEYGNYQPLSLGEGEYVAGVTTDNMGQLQVSLGNRNWEKQWQTLGVSDTSLVRGYAPPSDITEGSYVKDITQTDEGLKFVLGNRVTEAKLSSINTQLETISMQNQKFVDYYNADPAGRGKDFLKAMAVQNQQAASLLGEAESFGFITGEQRQTRISEMDVNMRSVRDFISSQEQASNMFAVNSNVERSTSAVIPTARGISAMPQDVSTTNVLIQGGTSWQKVTPTAPKVNNPLGEVAGLFGAFITNPVKATGALLNPIGQAISQDNTPLGQVARFGVGFVGEELNFAESIQKGVTNLAAGKSTVEPKPLINISLPGMTKANEPIYNPSDPIQITGKTAYNVASAVAISAVIPAAAPKVIPITASSILKAGLLNVGLTEGITAIQTELLDNDPTTKYSPDPVRISQSFALGEGFAVAGAGALKAASKIDPTIVASRGGRAAVSMGVGAGAGYLLSGGDPEQTIQGALVAGAFGVGQELVYTPLKSGLSSRLGFSQRLIPGEPTIGKSGEMVPTFISEKPITSLGNRRLRVVADVTENPVGSKGVTVKTLTQEYVGQNIPTAHATLNSKAFNLKAGGETVLRGFPEQGAGYRAQKELFHFYSAPGSKDFVNVYGGYAGITNASESAFKLTIGGKPTVLTTVNTPISRKFTPLPGESEAAYLSRTSRLPGETGIAQETMFGKSMERQFVTTASYERMGVQLQGSKFVSEGQVGKYQIKQLPTGRLGKVPIVRDALSTYTDLTVVKGRYAANDLDVPASAKALDVSGYNAAYESTRSISSPKSILSAGVGSGGKSNPMLGSSAASVVSLPKSFGSSPADISPVSASAQSLGVPSVSGLDSQLSTPSKPSTSNYPSPSIISPFISSGSIKSEFTGFSPSPLLASSTPSIFSFDSPPSKPKYSTPSEPIGSTPYYPWLEDEPTPPPPNSDPSITKTSPPLISPPNFDLSKRKRKRKDKQIPNDIDKWVRYYPVANPLEIL